MQTTHIRECIMSISIVVRCERTQFGIISCDVFALRLGLCFKVVGYIEPIKPLESGRKSAQRLTTWTMMYNVDNEYNEHNLQVHHYFVCVDTCQSRVQLDISCRQSIT